MRVAISCKRVIPGLTGVLLLSLPGLLLAPAVHVGVASLRMVQTKSLASLICWNSSGQSFTVFNPTEFAKQVLPQFFKHNNFQSFVRQVSNSPFPFSCPPERTIPPSPPAQHNPGDLSLQTHSSAVPAESRRRTSSPKLFNCC